MGHIKHRYIASKWLEQYGVRCDADDIVISTGSQNALSVILTSLLLKGDRIAVDELTYTGLKSLAKLLSIILIPVKGDSNGIDLDDLRNTCKRERVKGLYLIPDCHNPTTLTMSMEKRAEIARIVEDHRLILIEDGTFSFCTEECLKPISTICPENSLYIHGTSKALSPSFRLSYIIAPQKYVKLLKHSINNLTWMASPLTAEMVSLMQVTLKYDAVVKKKLEILKKRNQITDAVLKDFNLIKADTSLFRYLSLPQGFEGIDAEQPFLKAGVQVFSAKRFSIGMDNRHNAIRIAISSPENEHELVKGLELIKEVLRANQHRFEPIV